MHNRQKAESFGRWAEMLTIWYLRLKGYKIIAQRFRNHAGEIDIIAQKGKMIVFIEVKARMHGDNNEIVSKNQQQRIMRAAALFIAAFPAYTQHDCRFDLVIVRKKWLPEHICNAWQA